MATCTVPATWPTWARTRAPCSSTPGRLPSMWTRPLSAGSANWGSPPRTRNWRTCSSPSSIPTSRPGCSRSATGTATAAGGRRTPRSAGAPWPRPRPWTAAGSISSAWAGPRRRRWTRPPRSTPCCSTSPGTRSSSSFTPTSRPCRRAKSSSTCSPPLTWSGSLPRATPAPCPRPWTAGGWTSCSSRRSAGWPRTGTSGAATRAAGACPNRWCAT